MIIVYLRITVTFELQTFIVYLSLDAFYHQVKNHEICSLIFRAACESILPLPSIQYYNRQMDLNPQPLGREYTAAATRTRTSLSRVSLTIKLNCYKYVYVYLNTACRQSPLQKATEKVQHHFFRENRIRQFEPATEVLRNQTSLHYSKPPWLVSLLLVSIEISLNQLCTHDTNSGSWTNVGILRLENLVSVLHQIFGKKNFKEFWSTIFI